MDARHSVTVNWCISHPRGKSVPRADTDQRDGLKLNPSIFCKLRRPRRERHEYCYVVLLAGQIAQHLGSRRCRECGGAARAAVPRQTPRRCAGVNANEENRIAAPQVEWIATTCAPPATGWARRDTQSRITAYRSSTGKWPTPGRRCAFAAKTVARAPTTPRSSTRSCRSSLIAIGCRRCASARMHGR